MSYILDALRKAERERRLGSSPDVTTAQDVQPAKVRSIHSVWIYLLLGALFLNAGVLAWWLGPWNGKRPVIPEKAATENTVAAAVAVKPDVSAPAASLASLPSGKADVTKMPSVDTGGSGAIPSEKVNKAAEVGGMSPANAAVNENIAEKPAAVSSTKEDSKAATEPPPTGSITYAVNQLPSSVRQGLPNLTMSLHYFTEDPASRLISINGKTLREGEDVVPGLKLEKITVAGAVFDYKHYRFRIGLQSR